MSNLQTKLAFAPDDRRLILGTLAASVVYFAAYLVVYFVKHKQGALYLFGDFFAFWSESQFVVDHDPRQLYNAPVLAEYQRALRGDVDGNGYPFPYPPPYLLLIWPLRFLPYVPAFALWMASTMGIYLFAVLGARWRSFFGLGLLTAPASTLTIAAGQNGFLTAGFLIGGLRLAKSRPWLAGFFIGCLCYKPQFLIVLPVALAASRLWITFAASVMTVAGLFLVSSICFGFGIWQAWVQSLPDYGRMLAENMGHLHTLMPTVTATIASLGYNEAVAHWVQFTVGLATIVGVWALFRRGCGRLQIAGLCVAAFLITPYALVYDTPLITAATILCLEHQLSLGVEFDPSERFSLLTLWVAPLLVFFPIPVCSAFFMWAFVLIGRRILV